MISGSFKFIIVGVYVSELSISGTFEYLKPYSLCIRIKQALVLKFYRISISEAKYRLGYTLENKFSVSDAEISEPAEEMRFLSTSCSNANPEI